MGTSSKLPAPIIDTKIPAQYVNNQVAISFLMNKAIGWSQFWGLSLIIKTIQSNVQIANWECTKDSLIYRDGKYWATFNGSAATANIFTPGQTYKIQIAYISTDEDGNKLNLGHYSNISTFKFTHTPTIYIEGLLDDLNIHTYDYTGVYTNLDQSERVYTYRFDIYNESGTMVATSGDQLHNSAKDTSITTTMDAWSTRYTLENEKNYHIVYRVKTVNGLEASSEAYRIYNGVTFNSRIMDYCDFVADVNSDNGYVTLSIEPKSDLKEEKFISGQFMLLRASSEDGYKTWHEMTRFLLSSQSLSNSIPICRDYCVSQGVIYKYALQAFNKRGVYSNKFLAIPNEVFVDFEDMFLSDGERQLRIKFNPKVTSFKNTLLESKMDTLGSKYPFFFRNGNVSYKEFPISGLVSMLMDEAESFMSGILLSSKELRLETPAGKDVVFKNLPTALTGDNIRREREFKMEVLHWLINGKPKLFRSPSEGSYIVRLMNTSLSPNDTLGRMLHTFSCTAYEIDDFNFENLRKYGMMVDDYIEMRELEFKTISLDTNRNYNGVATGLSACTATIHTAPHTKFKFKLKLDEGEGEVMEAGDLGIFTFDPKVLAENELMMISPPTQQDTALGCGYWPEGSVLEYTTYTATGLMNFSHIDSVTVSDEIVTKIGDNKKFVSHVEDEYQLINTLGNIYYLKVQARPEIPVDTAELRNGQYVFTKNGRNYDPSDIGYQLIRCDTMEGSNVITTYYDGLTKQRIGSRNDVDFDFILRENHGKLNFSGTITDSAEELNRRLGLGSTETPIRNVNGGIILTNISDVDSLYLGQGLYADIAYQKVTRVYTVELQQGTEINRLKQIWLDSNKTNAKAYEDYYTALTDWCNQIGGDVIVDGV